MAIKFSQFVVQTNASALSHIVGYNGADNIQITPADFINSFVPGGPFLPLAGGTMTGDLKLNDDIVAKFGTSDDLRIQHVSGGVSYIQNYTGDLQIQNRAADKDILFRADDGTGVVTTYFYLDGSATNMKVSKDMRFLDNVDAEFGTGGDFKIYHDSSNMYLEMINSGAGDIIIQNANDDSDITFKSDDGSGGTTEYFRVDGGVARTIFTRNTAHVDNAKAIFGNGDDLQIYHNAVNSVIESGTGNLALINTADNKDIIFQSDDGAGGTATYFYLDGGGALTRFDKRLRMSDAVGLQLGSSGNFEMYHLNGNTTMDNFTGNLTIRNSQNDGNISFASDDGSGGNAEYFRVDGGVARTIFTRNTAHVDNAKAIFGNGDDLQIYHDGSNSYIDEVGTGFLKIWTNDLEIQSNSGTETLATFATNGAVSLYYDATKRFETTSTGANVSGDLTVTGTITGSGGSYLPLAGGTMTGNVLLEDNVKLSIGTSDDFNMFFNGTDTTLQNITGDLNILNKANDKDIIFQSDNGSGGTAEYFRVDGGAEAIIFSKNTQHADNVKVYFGNAIDLAIYHDGTDSFIDDAGTGDLRIRSNFIKIEKYTGETMATFNDDNSVALYFNNSKKFETTSTGVKVTGVSEFADNTAAIAGGLTTGDVYRTGDLLKIVH